MMSPAEENADTDRTKSVMADHQSQDVDSRLVQSVVDRTTDVDGNSPNSIQNLGGGKGDATDSTNASAPNASILSESVRYILCIMSS